MRSSISAAWLVAAARLAGAAADNASPSSTTPAPACTATSSSGSGAFFDLRPDMAARPDKEKPKKAAPSKDYHVKGHDYGKNFTMNICGPVVDQVTDVMGVKKNLWANVGAYYMEKGSVYSIGSQSLDLRSRGRKLVLQYTGGSPCGNGSNKSKRAGRAMGVTDVARDQDSAALPKPHLPRDDEDKTVARRKSATISFLCDQDPGHTQASVFFVGTDPDECAYFFEARSVHACAHAEPHKPGSVGPASVFSIILLIAVLVYALGGVFYNRTVANARGWRQLPNYSIWAGIWNFFSDTFTMLWDRCARCLPGRQGYRHLNANASSRHRNSEAENRLIDQLDEEWDD